MMNLSSRFIKHIPNKEEIDYISSCKFSLCGECQLLNKSCFGKNISKEICSYAEPDKTFHLTF